MKHEEAKEIVDILNKYGNEVTFENTYVRLDGNFSIQELQAILQLMEYDASRTSLTVVADAEMIGGDMESERMEEMAASGGNVRVEATVRRELIHRWMSKDEDFLAEIDKTGGWPTGYTHVSFFHDGPCGNRYCQFTTYPMHTEWWTTVATSDDYYYWKLSNAKKAEILKEARKQLIRQLN